MSRPVITDNQRMEFKISHLYKEMKWMTGIAKGTKPARSTQARRFCNIGSGDGMVPCS